MMFVRYTKGVFYPEDTKIKFFSGFLFVLDCSNIFPQISCDQSFLLNSYIRYSNRLLFPIPLFQINYRLC